MNSCILFSRPDLYDSILSWDNSEEIWFIMSQVGEARANGRGLEYGSGTGRVTLPLRRLGLMLDAMDMASESVRVLRNRSTREGLLGKSVVSDMENCILRNGYTFALSALNTIRYLPSASAVQRHLECAHHSTARNAIYLVHIASYGEKAGPHEIGSFSEWHAVVGGQRVTVKWIREACEAGRDFERVLVLGPSGVVFEEVQPQLAMSIDKWLRLLSVAGMWRVESVTPEARLHDGFDGSEYLDELPAGNYWLRLRRIGK